METFTQLLNPKLIWFLVGLVFIIAELLLPGLIVIFFGIGAWIVCAILFFIPVSLNIQLIIFLISTVASLLLLRRYFTKIFKGHKSDRSDPEQPLDDFIGKEVIADTDISSTPGGKVILNGTSWSAVSHEPIKKGTMVKIIAKDSLTFKVTPLT